MSKRAGVQSATNKQKAEPKIEIDQQYFRHVDQMQRWRNQYDYAQSVENELAELSKLSFEPVDYLSMLEKVPFVEQEIPNYDYLIAEAKEGAENRFVMPMVFRGGGILLGLLALIFGTSAAILWVAGTAIITLFVSIYILLQRREAEIRATIDAAQAEVARRREVIHDFNEKARNEHEETEKKRVAVIEQLLAGEIGSVILKIDVVVSQMDIPLSLQVDVDIYMNVPLIKIWLPGKKIIPEQTCELLPSGRIKFEDKDVRAINKQYVELCAALVMQIAAKIYENVPSFNRGYIEGISRSGLTNDCIISMSFEREALVEICNRAQNGVSALRGLAGMLECDTSLNFLPTQPPVVEEWGAARPQDIRSITVRIEK
ncbi:MAG: hypothetical protein LLG02_07780 [Pelosinus sp.]|nr:hypothetical protein [Pelosinus sp.]